MLLRFHSRKFCDSILTCDGVSCKFIHPYPRKPSSYSSAVTAHHAIESPVGSINGGKPTRSCQHSKSEANSDLIALCRDGNLKEALGVLQIMDRQRIPADFSAYASLIQACADTKSLAEGRQVHTHLLNAGLGYNVSFGAKLVNMYAVCGRLEDAREVFDKICEPDARQVLEKMHNSYVVIWNAMIRAYVKNENYERAFKLYHQMQRLGIGPDKFTFPLVLKACAGLSYSQEGREIHDQMDSRGLASDVFVVTALMDMYAKCGSIDSARQVFDKMSERDVVSWNAMIVGYCQNGHPDEALVLFHRMQATGIKPNSVTMVSVIPACADLAALNQGKSIHAYVVRNGFESDVSVVTGLVDMYAKCGRVEVSHQLFGKISNRDAVSWNAMIAGYAQNGYGNEALMLYHQMQLAGVKPNLATVVTVLPACAHLSSLQQGKRFHSYIIRSGLDSHVSVANSLIDMYCKCKDIEAAHILFYEMPKRDVVSWSVMISGYAQSGLGREALRLFCQMRLTDIKPNSATIISVLPACAQLAGLHQGKCIHASIIRNGFDSDISVGTALLTMYAKCGSIELARRLFEKMRVRDVVSWSAMITGYGMHGYSEEAIMLFSDMKREGMKPDHVTFIGVLSACSHTGLVDKGWQYFDSMKREYFITPRVEHYACMVDLLGRAGQLDEAYNFIKRMPVEPDASVWGALLGACRIHRNIELVKCVSEHLIELEPENIGNYVLLSNIYAASGRWDDVAKVRTILKGKGLKKSPGCSWIEVKNQVHAFISGDRSHPESEKIYAMLDSLTMQIKGAGYFPDASLALHDGE